MCIRDRDMLSQTSRKYRKQRHSRFYRVRSGSALFCKWQRCSSVLRRLPQKAAFRGSEEGRWDQSPNNNDDIQTCDYSLSKITPCTKTVFVYLNLERTRPVSTGQPLKNASAPMRFFPSSCTSVSSSTPSPQLANNLPPLPPQQHLS